MSSNSFFTGMMLHQTFNSMKESFGPGYFTSRVDDEIVQNLNPKFELREYQKEALGRFDFYFSAANACGIGRWAGRFFYYQKKQWINVFFSPYGGL